METSRSKIVDRLSIEGWTLLRHGSEHDLFQHPERGVVSVPRHRTLSSGVARAIGRAAGWR